MKEIIWLTGSKKCKMHYGKFHLGFRNYGLWVCTFIFNSRLWSQSTFQFIYEKNVFRKVLHIYSWTNPLATFLPVAYKMFYPLSSLYPTSIPYDFVSDNILSETVLVSYVCHEDSVLDRSMIHRWSNTSLSSVLVSMKTSSDFVHHIPVVAN